MLQRVVSQDHFTEEESANVTAKEITKATTKSSMVCSKMSESDYRLPAEDVDADPLPGDNIRTRRHRAQ